MVFDKKMKLVVLFMAMMSVLGVSMGATYKVGDDAGWSNDGKVNYTQWANSKSFHIGDIVVFEFNKETDTVAKVNRTNYKNCNSNGASVIDKSGNYSFTIKRDSHFFFISTVPGHCEAGEKVDFNTASKSKPPTPAPAWPPSPTPVTPSPTPTPPPSPDASAPSGYAPAPAPSGTSSTKGVLSGFSMLVFAICAFGIVY